MRTQNIKKQRTEQKDGEKTHFLNRKKKKDGKDTQNNAHKISVNCRISDILVTGHSFASAHAQFGPYFGSCYSASDLQSRNESCRNTQSCLCKSPTRGKETHLIDFQNKLLLSDFCSAQPLWGE